MARVSKQQMERNREEIIQVSSQLFRERGLNGVSGINTWRFLWPFFL